MNDTFEKLASSKWRALLRAGKLSEESVAKLRRKGLLNYGKESMGIEKGNVNLLKKLRIKDVTPEREPFFSKPMAVEDILKVVKGDIGKALRLYGDQIQTPISRVNFSPSGRPGQRILNMSNFNRVADLMDPKGKNWPTILPIIKRHEIDEIRYMMKMPELLKSPGFQVTRAVHPEITNEKMRLFRKIPFSSKILNTIKELKRTRPRELIGDHATPGVIMREAGNVNFSNPDVQKAFKRLRSSGEVELAKEVGTTYSKLSPNSPKEYRKLAKDLQARAEKYLKYL